MLNASEFLASCTFIACVESMDFLQLMFPSFASRQARSRKSWHGLGTRLLLLSTTIALSSCSTSNKVSQGVEKWLRWHPALSQAQERTVPFEFVVTPREQGSYELKGTTELPEGSQLAIAALRYLKLDPDVIRSSIDLGSEPSESGLAEPGLSESDPLEPGLNIQEISTFPAEAEQTVAQLARKRRLALKPSYVILDYQPVTVQEGQWQTELNLWQVAKDGRHQESWQLHQEELALQWKAEPEVIFLATLLIDGAADRLQTLQNQLAERQFTLNRSLIQTSLEGEQYFQAMQLLEVALPQSQTAPPPLRVQDINGGWGRRYLLVEQDPLPGTLAFPEQRHRNDPGSPREFIQ